MYQQLRSLPRNQQTGCRLTSFHRAGTLALGLGLLLAIPVRAVDTDHATGAPEKQDDHFLVFFEEPPLVHYEGGTDDLASTSPATRGEQRLNTRSRAAQAYLSFLDQRQKAHLQSMSRLLLRPVEPTFSYRAVVNGIATVLSPEEVSRVRKLEGVKAVIADRIESVDSDRGPTFIQAPSVWDGSSVPDGIGTRGEGIVVGIIDTGINVGHPSFAAIDDEGYTHSNPLGSGTYLGWCDPSHPNYDPAQLCNDKLIGAWDFVDAYCSANPDRCDEADGIQDSHGHGSHVAGTAAGNVLTEIGVSGVAPRANLISYDVCYYDLGTGRCPRSVSAAAVDQAVIDGVDVINFSISGGTSPWSEDDIDSFFLGAVAAGIVPVASAGNNGPSAGTVAHLGPWMTTVASSSHDRLTVRSQLVNLTGGISPPADLTGASRTEGIGPAPMVYAGNFVNGDADPERCAAPFPPGTFSGEIVLCDPGTINTPLKCENVAVGGAAGCVVANSTTSESAPIAYWYSIPSIEVGRAAGDALRAWLASGTGHTATLTDSVMDLDPSRADWIAYSSSRGPNAAFNSLKPDLAAPGIGIYAPSDISEYSLPPEFTYLSGTSMASPHVAGSVALLRALHPDWTPAEIKSALVLTANATMQVSTSPPADTLDFGGGRIDVSRAARTGLVLDEDVLSYLQANPDFGGSAPEELNTPNAQLSDCTGRCTFTRTFRSVASTPVTWRVGETTLIKRTVGTNPQQLTLMPGAIQTVEFTVNVEGQPLGEWVTDTITLEAPSAGPSTVNDLHLPIAVLPSFENLPESLRIESVESQGSYQLDGLRVAASLNNPSLTVSGLVQGTTLDLHLAEDMDDDPFDDLSEVYTKYFEVPQGTRRVVAMVSSARASDVDLFVGRGTIPGAVTVRCSSGQISGSARGRCELSDPGPGSYWIVVRNSGGSGHETDPIRLIDGLVSTGEVGNLTATSPGTIPAGQDFSISLNWDEPDFEGDSTWFAVLDVGTDTENPQDIETIAIDLVNPFLFADGFESGDTSRWSSP